MIKISKKSTAGFTLIEVLIALVVLSIGLLGVATLQAKSQQFSRNAYLNTQATVIAHDMLERMRANPAGLKSSFYNNPATTEHSDCFTTTGCSSQQMAENDMFEWSDHISKKLPNGKAVICIDSTQDDGGEDAPACDGVGSIYAVKVWWDNMKGTSQRVVTTVAF